MHIEQIVNNTKPHNKGDVLLENVFFVCTPLHGLECVQNSCRRLAWSNDFSIDTYLRDCVGNFYTVILQSEKIFPTFWTILAHTNT